MDNEKKIEEELQENVAPEEQEEQCDVIIIGTNIKKDYVGSRTFYLMEIFKIHFPELDVRIYDCYEQDVNNRLDTDKILAKNYIFLPWSETIDLNWIDFITSLKTGYKILYTENYDWYQKQKTRVVQLGFNLENIFNIISFSTRDNKSWWWNKNQYFYWGPCLLNSFLKDKLKLEKDEKTVFVDTPWDLQKSPEPYNALRVLDECMPVLKERHKLKIVSQDFDRDWVDENLDPHLELEEMIEHYSKCNLFIVSHHETCGYPQLEAQLCGVKIITTKIFSSETAILGGNIARELWSFEDGNQSFIEAIERGLETYDRELLQKIALQCFSETLFAENIKRNLWGLDL